MPERPRSEHPETSLATTSFVKIKEALAFLQRHARETSDTGKQMLRDEEIRIGSEAVLRGVINVGITLIDTVPGAGEIASWGADIAAVVEEIRFHKRKEEALRNGEDPDKVKREKYNLTPDVSVWVKTVTEVLEIIPIPLPTMMPTHGIETAGQLWYDVPRIFAALKKARKVLAEVRDRRARAKEAAERFRSHAYYENSSDDRDEE